VNHAFTLLRKRLMQRDKVLLILREHVDELRALHVASLSVFGSVARGEADPASDVDLLVECDRTVGLFHFLRVKERLSEMLGGDVDLVERDAVHPALRPTIFAEAIRAA
jgi:uncharacterized protein